MTTKNLGMSTPSMDDAITVDIPNIASSLNTIDTEFGLSGTTANRPTTNLYIGRRYFDTTIDREIQWDGQNWLNDAMTNAPTTGTWKVGNIVWNSSPQSGGNLGWVYTTNGWYAFSPISIT